jgi:hypothetical protein
MTEADCAMPLRWAPDPGAERIGPGPWAGAHAARKESREVYVVAGGFEG